MSESLTMQGKRECRCGAIVDADLTAMIEHVTSELHNQRCAALGIIEHNHSYRWVNTEGRPVEPTAPDAVLFRRPGCPACDTGP